VFPIVVAASNTTVVGQTSEVALLELWTLGLALRPQRQPKPLVDLILRANPAILAL
jgi:hypothetical protein